MRVLTNMAFRTGNQDLHLIFGAVAEGTTYFGFFHP